MIEIPEWYNASVLVDRNLEAGRVEKVAIYFGDERVTYGELARRINRFGHALRALGVDREDRVLLMLNDTPAFPTAFFAAMRIGAIPIPVNTLLQPADYRFFVEDSRARVVVCDQMHHETIRQALEGYDEEPVEVIVTNGRAEGARVLEDLLEVGRTSSTRSRRTKTIRRSGSTARALPAGPRALSTCTTTSSTPARPTPGTCWRSPRRMFASRPPSSSTPTGSATASPSRTGPGPRRSSSRASPRLTPSLEPPSALGRRSTTRCSTTRAPATTTSPPSACASRRRRRCPLASGAAGRRRSARSSSTASARRRCSTSSSPTRR